MELTLAEFVVMVVAGAGLLVLFFTMISRTNRLRTEAQSAADRVVCRLCLHVFEAHGHDRIISCPQCRALNEKGRDRRLG